MSKSPYTEKLEAIWKPGMGRPTLHKLSGIPVTTCQRFLQSKNGTQQANAPKQAAVDINQPLIDAGLATSEIDAILQSMKDKRSPAAGASHHITWGKDSFKFAAIGDTHFGHIKSNEDWWLRMCDLVDKEKCDLVFHAGDITEGMSQRPGHFYELNAVGVTAQLDMAADRLSLIDCPIHAITGNHDAWAYKHVGVDVGQALAGRLKNYHNLGPDEGDMEIDGVKIKLWHGGDGSSYALSYRCQKFVEGLTGGEKPHILLSGHAHKAIQFDVRNVMCYEVGTLCGQTGWMRGKKLSAHCGFWIVEVFPAAHGGIERIKSEWVPFFREG